MAPDGTPVTKGQYGYHSPDEKRFIRVVPCGGKDGVIRIAKDRLEGRLDKPWDHLILSVDSDLNADGSPNPTKKITPQGIQDLASNDNRSVSPITGGFEVDFRGETSQVLLMEWSTFDPSSPGLPNQQTLERLVCAAIKSAYSERADTVQKWLDSRGQPPPPDPKDHAWSYMAGWYAEHGCQDFFRHLWDDEKIMPELRSRLQQSGDWDIAQELIK